jgi:hypothetical protein
VSLICFAIINNITCLLDHHLTSFADIGYVSCNRIIYSSKHTNKKGLNFDGKILNKTMPETETVNAHHMCDFFKTGKDKWISHFLQICKTYFPTKVGGVWKAILFLPWKLWVHFLIWVRHRIKIASRQCLVLFSFFSIEISTNALIFATHICKRRMFLNVNIFVF